jgi:hypothetical protein
MSFYTASDGIFTSVQRPFALRRLGKARRRLR